MWACRACYASLFTDRAIKYRNDNGFDHLKVALSVGVQRMVRSDPASSGVCFTIDPDSGHNNLMLITGSWGLGENVVLNQMAQNGLRQHENGLEVYVMAEIPSNIIRAQDFGRLFDGFSIGSNDLTQLTLGVDRDSSTVQGLFNENDPAVRDLIAMLLLSAHHTGTPVGICGQGPSDNPAFAEFLVKEGINSLSFNPDVFLRGLVAVGQAEEKLLEHTIGF
ncbi:MAG: hypothetical protein LH609_21865 [Rudanella sp.]|nr:hypothetical protein [Rudanella sp.]